MSSDRFLVLNLNQIGAVVLATPVFRALKEAYPKAYVSTLVRDSMVPLLQGNPYVDRVFGWDRSWSLGRKLGVVRALRRERFDVSLDLSHSLERTLLSRLSGARVRVGFDTSEAPFLHTLRVQEQTGRYHATERNLDLVRALGVTAEGAEGFRLYLSDHELAWREAWAGRMGLAPGEPLVGLNSGASIPSNHWPVEYFSRLGDLLMDQGHRVVLLGGPMDVEEAQSIADGMKHKPLFCPGHFGLRELAAVLSRLSVLVTGDTGPMHMAVALRVPVVALFGPADPQWTGPYCGPRTVLQREDLPCIRCIKKQCPTQKECLYGISPEAVLEAVEGWLSGRPAEERAGV